MNSIVESDECTKCIQEEKCDFNSRIDFNNNCLPFLNIQNSNINILNWNYTNYIYFDINNQLNYYFDYKFKLNKYLGTLPSENTTYNIKNFDSLINFNFKLNNTINVPIYYLYVNKNNNIFDLFISSYIYLTNGSENLLFRFNEIDYKFIALTYKFEIFNISLTCNKFFDVFELFLSDINEVSEIKDKLKKIFTLNSEVFNFENLYFLINKYKFKLDAINRKDIEFSKSKRLVINNNSNKSNKRDIIKYETNKYEPLSNETNFVSNEKIYDELASSIEKYKRVFKEIEKIIPNYTKIFIMSILQNRIKDKFKNGTWTYDSSYIYNYINNYKFKNETTFNFENIYLKNKLIIYEYSSVLYKDITYGNCMENTILQFLKILFFNPRIEKMDNYFIKKIINEDVLVEMGNIFNDIGKEKTKIFDEKWVKFVTELPERFPKKFIEVNNKPLNYIFIKQIVELDSSLVNLITFLRYVTNVDYETNDNILNKEKNFLNTIVKKINENYSIDIDIGEEKQILNLYVFSNYKMVLDNKKHAHFENAKLGNQNIITTNILERIKTDYSSIKDYLSEEENLTLSDIINYICLIYLENPEEGLVKNYIKNLTLDKIYDSFSLLFLDNVFLNLPNKSYMLLLQKEIEEYLVFNNLNQNLLINTIIKIDVNDYWDKFINIKNNGKKLYINWSKNIWITAYKSLYNNGFWKKIVEEKIYVNWSNELWNKCINNLSNEFFWETINYDEISEEWDEINYIEAIKYLKYDKFYKYLIKNKVYEQFTQKKLWIVAVQYIQNNYFWENIPFKQYFIEWDNDILNIALTSLKNQIFYETIISEKTYKKWDENTWLDVTYKIKNDYFWNNLEYKSLLYNWNSNFWISAFINININILWKNVIKYKIYNKWNTEEWNEAIKSLKNNYFWSNLPFNELNKKWYITHLYWAIFKIETDNFWTYFIENLFYNLDEDFNQLNIYDKKIDYFKAINNHCNNIIYWNFINETFIKNDVWKYEDWVKGISEIKSDVFWKIIIDNKIYLKWFNIINNLENNTKNLWDVSFMYLKNEYFWENVDYNIVEKDWNLNNWLNIINYECTNFFWKNILEKEYYKKWNSERWDLLIKSSNCKYFWQYVNELKLNYNFSNDNWLYLFKRPREDFLYCKLLTIENMKKWNSETWANYFKYTTGFWEDFLRNELWKDWSEEIWLKIININVDEYLSQKAKITYFWECVGGIMHFMDSKSMTEKWTSKIWIDFIKKFSKNIIFGNIPNIIINSNNWNDDVWNVAFINIEDDFWINITEANIYKKWNNNIWKNYFIELNSNNNKIFYSYFVFSIYENSIIEFWKYIFDYNKYSVFENDKIKFINEFKLKKIYNKLFNDSENNNLTNEENYRNKYLKYKNKYINLLNKKLF